MSRKIILDCDPGHDDAVAMLLAHANPNIELLAVTTVGGKPNPRKGNQQRSKPSHRLRDARRTELQQAYPPATAPVETAPDCHGDSGLDGVELPEPVALDPRHAVDVIIETVMSHAPGEITLVPTGPLTNIALAVRKEPRIVERVREVVLMGGGYHVGNWSAVAEFNIKVDPEAAHIVSTSPGR